MSMSRSDSPFSLMAFVSNRAGSHEIYLMMPDGKQVKRLTFSHTADTKQYLAWQPHGRNLLFMNGTGTRGDIREITIPNGTIRILQTQIADYHALTWSADGGHYLFSASYTEAYRSIYQVDHTSGQSEKIVDIGRSVYHPEPLAHPKIFLLSTAMENGTLGLYRYESATGDLAVIIDDIPDSESDPTPSPNGQQMAYTNFQEGKSEIYVLDIESGKAINLTAYDTYAFNPQWSPDGQWLYYTTNVDGNFEIYRMHPDGSTKENLTQHPADDLDFTWSSPIGHRWHENWHGLGALSCVLLGILKRLQKKFA